MGICDKNRKPQGFTSRSWPTKEEWVETLLGLHNSIVSQLNGEWEDVKDLGKPLMKQGIDLFCGIGGSSAGAELAGFEITWACNHDPVAINVHELNHPNTTHACEDALLTNYFDDVPDCDFMLASPACQGHSTASQPKRRRYHEESRASAWAVIQAIDAKRPSTVIIENTPGFVRWDGYNAWTNAIESFGYNIQTHLLNAADFEFRS